LDDESQQCNENEDPVVENSSEDVELSFFKKSSIELIEKLHEHKDLEHIGEMKKLHSSGHFWNISWCNLIFSPV